MNNKTPLLILPLIVVALIVGWSSLFILPEGHQAIITEFGKPIGKSIVNAGLHFKKPFVQDVRRLDKRIIYWDGYPNQIPTRDKKYIMVDTTARWKISDPLKFIQTVQNERGVQSRLDAVLDAITRDTISNHNLVEAVRNSNSILDRLHQRKQPQEGTLPVEAEEITGEIEKIIVGREKLSEIIIERARTELEQFGIKLIDVQLRHIAYEDSVQKKVYERMISERKRIAEKIRSIGKGEQAKIQGKTTRDLQQIQSEAYRKAQVIKGTAEAEAIRIYAEALSQDPSFYEFVRTLEAYKNSFRDDTKVILSTHSDFLKMLRNK